MAGIIRWHGRSINGLAKRVRNGLEKEKPIAK